MKTHIHTHTHKNYASCCCTGPSGCRRNRCKPIGISYFWLRTQQSAWMRCCGKANLLGLQQNFTNGCQRERINSACVKYRYCSGLGQSSQQEKNTCGCRTSLWSLAHPNWCPCRLDILILLYYTTNTGILHLLKAVLHRAAVTIFFL